MQSDTDQPEPDADEQGTPDTIPTLARNWGSTPKVTSAVRRPFPLPDHRLYHEIIETGAIFELDEEQKDGSVETILVVPFPCTRCKQLKQACSRMRPACTRCRKAGSSCKPAQEGYQRLPRPKAGRPSMAAKRSSMSHAWESSTASSSQTSETESTADRSRLKRRVPRATSLSAPLVASGSKRTLSLSPDSVPPRKKKMTKTTSGNGKKMRRRTIAPPEDIDMETLETFGAPNSESTSLKWTFVKNARVGDPAPSRRQECAGSTSGCRTPRVWTNSLNGLLAVFPQLVKAPASFSWFQFEAPILLLDSNYARGRWIDSTTLVIEMSWSFSCYHSELEPAVESASSPSTIPSELPLPAPPTNSPSPTGPTQGEPNKDPIGGNLVDSMQDDSDLTLLYPSSPAHDPLPPRSDSAPHESVPTHGISYPRVPLVKPPEVETLLDSHARFIPLLLWIPHHSELAPCDLSPDVDVSSRLSLIGCSQHGATQPAVCAPEVAQGQVCWSVTLQWAPGGEDALFDGGPGTPLAMTPDSAPLDGARDLMHPWWLNPTDTPPQADQESPYYQRDKAMQLFSCIPLDILADFHPSESFPRAWFCRSCGMINMQEFFRHRICGSTKCKNVRKTYIPEGKVDPLSSLRDPYQSSTASQPTDKIPSIVDSHNTTWNDGRQTWMYGVRDGVTLCHIFTGNQEALQADATTLLETIQREVLLRKQDPSSPYFIHTTRLLYPNNGSGATVPQGTPDCVRTAYYMLRDFVDRYGEMDTPRFGTVRIQAWVHPGSKRGSVFRAKNSPAVIHCLGVEAVLNLIPKGGYKEAVVPRLTRADKGKGKGRVDYESRPRSPPPEPLAGSSRSLDQDSRDPPSSISLPEINESVIVTEHADKATAVMDTGLQCLGPDASDVAKSNSNAPHIDSVMEGGNHEVAEPNPAPGRKKNKVTKGKSKTSVPEISMTLMHGDCVVLFGDDFECQIVRAGTTILVMGFPEGA